MLHSYIEREYNEEIDGIRKFDNGKRTFFLFLKWYITKDGIIILSPLWRYGKDGFDIINNKIKLEEYIKGLKDDEKIINKNTYI